MLNQFNEGGTHEQNPIGGIPMGMGSNGQMNTVEQGETMKDNFVYSDRIVLTPEILGQFNLPKSFAGKTVAQVTKLIDKQFDGRNDRISKSTQKSLLDKTAQAQETIKAQEEQMVMAEQQAAQELQPSPEQMQQIPPDQMMQQAPPQEGFVPQQQMFLGGRLKQNQMFLGGDSYNSLNNSSVDLNNITENTATAAQAATSTTGAGGNSGGGNSGAGMGAIGAGLGAIGSGLSSMKDRDEFYDPINAKKEKTEDMVGKTKDTVAGFFGPFGALFRGIEKAGHGIGDAVGGETGTYISSAFSPDESIMRANQDPDIKTGDKVLGMILPFHAAKMARKAEQARQAKFKQDQAFRRMNAWNNDFANGGILGGPGDPEKKLPVKEGSYNAPQVTQQQIGAIKKFYKDKGFDETVDPTTGQTVFNKEPRSRYGKITGYQPGVQTEKGRGSYYYGPEFPGGRDFVLDTAIPGREAIHGSQQWKDYQTALKAQNQPFIDAGMQPLSNIHLDKSNRLTPEMLAAYKAKQQPVVPVAPIAPTTTVPPTTMVPPVSQVAPVTTQPSTFAYGGNVFKYRNGGNIYKYANGGEIPPTLDPNYGAQPFAPNQGLSNYEVKPFQDYLDKNRPGWVAGSSLNQGRGYGTYGPSTREGFRLYGDEFRGTGPELPQVDPVSASISQGPQSWRFTDSLGDSQNNGPASKEKDEDKEKSKLGIQKEKIERALTNLGRMAPGLMNAYQLRELKKRGFDTVKATLNDKRFTYDPVDEARLENIIRNETNNTVGALTQMGGSTGATRNAILAAGLNAAKARSEAYGAAADKNAAMDMQTQQMQNAITEANIGRRTAAEDKTAENKGRFLSEMSAGRTALAKNIGDFSKENWQAKALEKATGYNVYGEYMQNPKTGTWLTLDGKPATMEQVKEALKAKAAKDKETQEIPTEENVKALGGYLSRYNKKPKKY